MNESDRLDKVAAALNDPPTAADATMWKAAYEQTKQELGREVQHCFMKDGEISALKARLTTLYRSALELAVLSRLCAGHQDSPLPPGRSCWACIAEDYEQRWDTAEARLTALEAAAQPLLDEIERLVDRGELSGEVLISAQALDALLAAPPTEGDANNG